MEVNSLDEWDERLLAQIKAYIIKGYDDIDDMYTHCLHFTGGGCDQVYGELCRSSFMMNDILYIPIVYLFWNNEDIVKDVKFWEDSACDDAIREEALSKLTEEEREALGWA